MKQISRFLVIVSFLIGGHLHAQSISGTIVDEYNEPLPSVSISAEDGTATSTNFNGQYTLSLKPGKHVVTYTFIGYQSVKWNEMMAASIVGVFPVLIVFVFLQKYIVEGLTAGAVKN